MRLPEADRQEVRLVALLGLSCEQEEGRALEADAERLLCICATRANKIKS